MRIQADLIDQLCNSSEKRLARILLLMAERNKANKPEKSIRVISQETLAEMFGTTRARVSFFMNRRWKLGYIKYRGRTCVRKSLLNVILHGQRPTTTTDTVCAQSRRIARRRQIASWQCCSKVTSATVRFIGQLHSSWQLSCWEVGDV
jgi:hypothetical protein